MEEIDEKDTQKGNQDRDQLQAPLHHQGLEIAVHGIDQGLGHLQGPGKILWFGKLYWAKL